MNTPRQNRNRLPLLKSALVFFALQQAVAAAEWVAFNDCVDTDPGSTPDNATSYGLGRSYLGDGISGKLIDFVSGVETGVTVSFTENTSAGNTINWATDSADFTAGTDAEEIFAGKLNLTGNMSYNDSPGWSLDVTFTGLDPAAAYTFAATIHRNGGDGYRNRISNWRINGADASTYASSVGAHKVDEESVEFITGHNPEGLVARWTDIRPGVDGAFSIRSSHGIGLAAGGLPDPDSFRGYAAGLFMLMLQPDPQALAISSVAYDAQSDSATITWPARSDCEYEVEASNDLIEWQQLDDNVSGEGGIASYTEEGVAGQALGPRRFYRVRQR